MNENTDFAEFRKIARLNRDCVITEKIDGTNAQVLLYESNTADPMALMSWTAVPLPDDVPDGWLGDGQGDAHTVTVPQPIVHLRAGSRTRWITPENDNHGFARWAKENADDLFKLGLGRHYGEWWGQGIQRKYGLKTKRYSLFNTNKWNGTNIPLCCDVVPVLFAGRFTTEAVEACVNALRLQGSQVAPGFMKAEGVVVYHTHANQYFKVTLEHDELPKSQVPKEEPMGDHQPVPVEPELTNLSHRLTAYL